MRDALATAWLSSPLGPIALTATASALVSVELGATPAPGAAPPASGALLAEARRQLAAYFAGRLREFDLPLAPTGTPFQLRVWQALRTIPYGETTTYGALAARLGQPGAARAVGGANHDNPLGIVIPCHRVIGANGALIGYAGGLDKKAWLLAHESPQRSLRAHHSTSTPASASGL